ncbi:acyltransferase [Rugamonas sp. A1-17]|nr:acyltransferase [Rugamonas sp. A1-17]
MKRRQEIELLRILSAFGIVWYHTATVGRDIAYSGLIAFLIISMYFSARAGGSSKTMQERARTLLVPWLIWFVFYGFLNVVSNRPYLALDHGIIAGFLAGTSIHLWYLPFIFLAIVFFDRIKEHIDEQTLSYVCIFLAAAILVLNRFWRDQSLAFNYPYAQYAHALDGVLMGVFFANCSALPRALRTAFISIVLAACFIFALPVPGVGIPYLIGITVAAIILLPKWDLEFDFDIKWISECTLGIYLSHIFWLKVIKKVANINDLVLPFLVFAISALTVWAFKKTAPNLAKYAV